MTLCDPWLVHVCSGYTGKPRTFNRTQIFQIQRKLSTSKVRLYLMSHSPKIVQRQHRHEPYDVVGIEILVSICSKYVVGDKLL